MSNESLKKHLLSLVHEDIEDYPFINIRDYDGIVVCRSHDRDRGYAFFLQERVGENYNDIMLSVKKDFKYDGFEIPFDLWNPIQNFSAFEFWRVQ
jgi:hypothetical protein